MTLKTAFHAALAALALVTTAAPAEAATVIDLNAQTSSFGASGNGNGYRYLTSLNGEALNLQITGWSITTTQNPQVKAAKLFEYGGGLGVTASGDGSGSPYHAIDNNGGYDFILLQFDRAVSLDSIGLGWVQGDSDMTIRYGTVDQPWNLLPNANNNPIRNESQSVLNALLPNTFNIMGDGNEGDREITDGGTGNWWMISALNGPIDRLVQCTTRRGRESCVDQGPSYDYFKIDSIEISAPTGVVPEPSTWAMMIAGIGFAGAAVRRRNKVALRFGTAAA